MFTLTDTHTRACTHAR